MDALTWIFLGVIIGSIAYLAQIVLSFMDSYRTAKDRIEQSLKDLERIETQLDESEHARNEAESRSAKFEEETLLLEQEISELQGKINSMLPKSEAESPQ
jgi:septal ring factor EnvC (AmiA/AmiB activator)